MFEKLTRRNLVKKSVAVSAGALGLGCFEEKHLIAQISKADKKVSKTQKPIGKMTYGKIKPSQD